LFTKSPGEQLEQFGEFAKQVKQLVGHAVAFEHRSPIPICVKPTPHEMQPVLFSQVWQEMSQTEQV
jgi:hypothetical protein